MVEYETVVFTGGLKGDPSKFIGYSESVDEAWDELYNRLFHPLNTSKRKVQDKTDSMDL